MDQHESKTIEAKKRHMRIMSGLRENICSRF